MSRIRLDSLDEDAPFLINIDELADEPIPTPGTPPLEPLPRCRRRRCWSSWQATKPSTIIWLVCIAKFLIVTSGMLMLMPMYRLIEDAFCHRHYQDDSPDLIDEMKCKVAEVQSPLAFLMGWLGVLNSIMNLICSYPYGMLSDKIGRKPTALISYSGLALSFAGAPFMLGEFKYILRANPNILLYACVFQIIGGGVPVLMATLFAFITDVSSEENKASNYLYLTMGATTGALLGPFLAGVLMERYGPWVPIVTVLCTIPMVYIVFLFIPETLVVDIKKQQTDDQSPTQAIKAHIAHGIKDLLNSLNMVKNLNVLLCLVPFFFTSARNSALSGTLAQYMSKNFDWTLAEVSILLSPLGIITIIVLAALPKLSETLVSPRFGYTSFGKDLLIGRWTFFILGVSALIRAFSTSVIPFLFGLFIGCFGAAENAVVRATITNFVDPAYTSRLFALVGMVETLGVVTGPPALAWFFDLGMRLKGIWTGLPWFYTAVACFVPWLALLFVRPPIKDWSGNDVFGASDEEEADVRPSNPVRLE